MANNFMAQKIPFTTNRVVYFVALILALSLDVTSVASAASLTVQCKIGGARSSVAMRSTGAKGRYFVKIFSGDSEIQ